MSDEASILAGLDEEQTSAVVSTANPLVVIAGAGSGKTRVLTHRIAYRAATGTGDPEKTLAVTFTRKAASELFDRLRGLGVEGPLAGTFHSIAYRWLKNDRRIPAATKVVGSKSSILYRLFGKERARPATLREVAREIEWAKSRLIPPDRYIAAAAERRTSTEHATIAGLYKSYETAKQRRGVIDFEDMLIRLSAAIDSDPRLAAELQMRHRHIYVDEFQDVSPLQYRMLTALTGEDSDLFVVGDPDQAIFSFAGADSGYLAGMPDRRDSAEVIRLTANYRSTPEIIEAANSLLLTARPTGTDERTVGPLRSTLPSGPTPALLSFEHEQAEAKGIARLVRDGYDSRHRWRSTAILYRIAAQSAPLETALREMNIPYTVREGAFADRPEIATAIRQLKEADPAPGIPLPALVSEIAAQSAGSDEERANLDLLIAMADEFEDGRRPARDDPSGPVAFADYVKGSLGRESPAPRTGNAVSLLTLHSAKGLEFRTVFISGCETGLMPIHHARTPTELEEERRLLYVGITRAEQSLTLTWAKQRTLGQGPVSRERSPLLAHLETTIRHITEREVPKKDWPGEIAKQRALLRESLGRAEGT